MMLRDAIKQVLDQTSYRANPYFVNLNRKSFAKEDFVETQIQFYFAVVFFSRPMAALAAKIPEARLRVEVVRNVWEEHGEGDAERVHGHTFLALLELLGHISEQDVAKRALWPEVRIFNTTLVGACVLDEYLIGVAMMGIIERMFCDISTWIGHGIVDNNWISQERMIHYNLHEDLDIKHSQDFFDILEPAWSRSEEDRYAIAQGLHTGAVLFNGLYEGLWAGRSRRLFRNVAGAALPRMRLVKLTRGNEAEFGEKVRALESAAVYPLGNDRFRLDHGADYFAFFRRLGSVRAYALEIEGRVACVASGVLRRMRQVDGRTLHAWYLCDLKVAPEFRGRHLPARLFGRVLLPNYLRCPRGFAVTMNPGDGSPNRVVGILQRFPWAPLREVGQLAFYVWSERELADIAELLNVELGAWRLRSLSGIKDLILESTRQPWRLFHIEGPQCIDAVGGTIVSQPVGGAAHMLCVPRDGLLAKRLNAGGYQSSATATIVAHRMNSAVWESLASSEI